MLIVRNRLLALLYRLAGFAALVVGLWFYFQFPREAWDTMTHYGTWSGILMTAIFGMEIVFNAIDLRHGIKGVAANFFLPITLCVIGYCLTSAIGYFAWTIYAEKGQAQVNEIVFHVILLVVPLLEWLLFEPKKRIPWYTGFFFLVFPIFYAVFIAFRPIIWPDAILSNGSLYPLAFLDPHNDLYFLYLFLAALALYAVSMALILLTNLMAGAYVRRVSPLDYQ